jgi:hypothetical protein
VNVTETWSLRSIIDALESTDPAAWATDVVRTKDGRNCLFGHLFELGGAELWDEFEERVATTFMVYPVNDGQNPDYQQDTAKGRVIAYLNDIDCGAQKTTPQLMEEDYEHWLASQKTTQEEA